LWSRRKASIFLMPAFLLFFMAYLFFFCGYEFEMT